MKNKFHPLRTEQGFSLLEALVAILIAALGVLGILGTQMRTLTDTSTTFRRGQAIRFIEDISERLRVNPNAFLSINDYVSSYAKTAADYEGADCFTNACTPLLQAKYDLLQWKTAITENLPAGQASIFLAPGETQAANRRQLGIIIAWRENEREGTKTQDIDASYILDNTGEIVSGTNADNACPVGFTCHLQYITVAARCVPYGSTSTSYCI